jgi:hypothetical protein
MRSEERLRRSDEEDNDGGAESCPSGGENGVDFRPKKGGILGPTILDIWN